MASSRAEGAGILHVVATPIGNLEDVTLRALRVLRESELVLAEDTRHTRHLLDKHGIGTRLRAFHAHSSDAQLAKLVAELAAGARYALVTDAGTPLVSDPGARLVSGARDAGVRVEAVPGASAVTAALTVAGLRFVGFLFLGFLPRGGGKRREQLERVAKERGAVVLFEAPNRIAETLVDLAAACGPERRAAVCRELTKLHEEVVRAPLGELAARFAEGARGEITLVIEGREDAEPETVEVEDAHVRVLVAEHGAGGASRVLAQLAGIPRREAYARVLQLAGEAGAEGVPAEVDETEGENE